MNWPKEDLRLSINTPVRCCSFMLFQCYFNGFCKVYLMLIQNMLLYLKFFFFFFGCKWQFVILMVFKSEKFY